MLQVPFGIRSTKCPDGEGAQACRYDTPICATDTQCKIALKRL